MMLACSYRQACQRTDVSDRTGRMLTFLRLMSEEYLYLEKDCS